VEVPILEERKRGPTRHPKDLEEYCLSISGPLDEAKSQVTTQAGILFSSPRFLDQNIVILLATAGEYYRIAVLKRDHDALLTAPSPYDIDVLVKAHINPDLGDDSEDFCGLLAEGSTLEEEKRRLEKTRGQQEIERQKRARDARAEARAAREKALSRLIAGRRERSLFVLNAGPPPYPDGMLEEYYKFIGDPDHQRYPTFFEPEPIPGETISSLAQLNPRSKRVIVFTGVIRLGSSVSDKFIEMIKAHITEMAHAERARRE
jgi:hypothetical protein